MSYATVFQIRENGQVEDFADVRNGMAGAPVIWRELSKKYRVDDPMSFGGDKGAAFWKLFADPRVSRGDKIVIGFTFDAVWVRRDHNPELVEALRAFDRQYCAGIVPTIAGLATALQRLHDEKPSARGACFQMTSVSDAIWSIEDGEDEYRRFDFSRDSKTKGDHEPYELFDKLEARDG